MPDWIVIGGFFLLELAALTAAYLLGGRTEFDRGREVGRMETAGRAYRDGVMDGMRTQARTERQRRARVLQRGQG